MADNSWAYDLENKIFTLVKAKVTPQISKKFKNPYFTMSDRGSDKPQFPTIYIHSIGGVEERLSLETDSIETIRATFQIDVMAKNTQADASYVMSKVCDAMKELGFVIVSMPTFDNLTEVYRQTARFRRFVDSVDTFK